ncbi:MAG: hypothetical protein LC799_18695, partial [Actinobacteria bacterium]|nr:hypothetical protein [Actinomycetota bacterium]
MPSEALQAGVGTPAEARSSAPMALAAEASGSNTISTMAGRGSGDGGPALDAVVYGPGRLAVDTAGDVFFIDWQFLVTTRIRKVDGSGTVSTVAGGVAPGGEGGLSSLASFGVASVTPDASGNLWLTDPGNHRVQMLSPSGVITTVAGNGTAGFSGDGGPATAAQLSNPYAVAVDGAGNAYVADTGNHRVRKIDASGVITTIAGDGIYDSTGDGGPATAARLGSPEFLAVDGSGGLIVGGGEQVRRIDATGIISTVAGNGSWGFSGDGGPATAAGLERVAGLALDGMGNLYVAETARVRKVDTSGIIRTVAGTGESGWSTDTGPATAKRIGAVSGIAVDSAGTLYIGDYLSHRIRKVTGNTISTFAGGGTANIGDGGPATDARLAVPAGIGSGPDGSLYVADFDDHRIRRVDRSGAITTVAGTGTPGFSGDGGPATAAQLQNPIGVAADGAGNVYITDSGNNRIRRIDPGGRIQTIAGDGTYASSGDGGPASAAQLGWPYLITVDAAGAVYFSESSRVRRIDPGGTITTVAGTGSWEYSGDGGPATAAGLNGPLGLAVDGAGNLFIGDWMRLRRVDTSGIITTVAGTGTSGYSGDGGPAVDAEISVAAGLAVDASGNLFFADVLNWRVRRVDANGIISTVAGNGVPGEAVDGGPATEASFDFPYGVALDGSDLIVSDPYNSRVRRVGGVANAGPGTNADPVWPEWHYGDVHAHAAGDDNLKVHPQCEDRRPEATCAEHLVHNMLARAERFDTEWIIFTEHGPWLGFQRDNEVNLYDAEQAEREWTMIKRELDEQSTSEIRGLIGEELGTASPSCSVLARRNGPLRSPGHFGVYYTPSFVDNSMMDCNETGENGYADHPEGGWGGINHPDNNDGGSRWNCYSTEVGPDGELRGAEHQPQLRRSERCSIGADQYAVTSPNDAGSFRTMEIINGENLPSAMTLGLWDMYLQNGYRVTAVGGGDGHTAPRKFKWGDALKCLWDLGPLGKSIGECVDDSAPEQDGNHDKVGGSGRTLTQYPAAQSAVSPG